MHTAKKKKSIALGRVMLRINSHYSRTLEKKRIKCATNNYVVINVGGGKVTFGNRQKEPAPLESIRSLCVVGEGFSFREK